ncbi:collagen alpha-6(VI) chain-like [Pholidichthys leucotaenia]
MDAPERFADIFFLVDSGISRTEFQQVRTLLIRLSNQLNIGASAHRLGLAQYGQNTRVEFLLNAHQSKQETQTAVRRFRQSQLQLNEPRNLHSALQHAADNFLTPDAGSRRDQGFRQFLVALSGKDFDEDVYQQSRLIRSEGGTVVLITFSQLGSQTPVIATAPHVYQFNQITAPSLKIIFESEQEETTDSGGPAVTTTAMPTTERGEESVVTGAATPAMTTEEYCEEANLADIVFIVDESGSITTENFKEVRRFLHSFVSSLEIGLNKVQVGIVMYSDTPKAEVYLNDSDKKDKLLNSINNLPYHGGGTKTGAALKVARENVFIKSKGSRIDKSIQQVAVVITDGESEDNVSKAAADLRGAGVTVYAVGVKNANMTELKQMASHPTEEHMFSVDSFAELKRLQKKLQKMICYNIQAEAVSSERRSGIKEGCKETDEADFYFLIDHSGSIQYSDFSEMKKFTTAFINTFRIGPQYVRMGVAKYSDSPELEFDLTAYSDAASLKKAVNDIKQEGGGTNTGSALEFMGPLFDKAKESRDVKKYLVVITDGKSQDKVKAPAEKLRSQNIIIYAIGVKDANEAELEEIAGDRQRSFYVNNFDALKKINDSIIAHICSEEVCKDQPGNFVFLIDSSGNIHRQEFDKMKNFTKSVIIGHPDTDVRIVQIGTEAKLALHLDRNSTKEEMLNSIDQIKQIGGKTNTGNAIGFASQYFTVARDSQEVRQKLVVITHGKAQDSFTGPAKAVRDMGVVIYTIGVGNANIKQLQEISGPLGKNIYAGIDFDSLRDKENQVILELCDPKDCKKTEKADIIFLVDGSGSVENDFESMQTFMKSLVNKTTLGKDLTRFGIILYSTGHESVYTLNQTSSKQHLFDAIGQLKPPLDYTYTAEAMSFSLQFFGAGYGGRAEQQVPQILMVITDGEANGPASLADASATLKNNKISVISIGIKDAKREQLEIMTGNDKSKVFYVDDFKDLEKIYKKVSEVLCNETKPDCEKGDLVFLVDQSGSITEDNYNIAKNFTQELVKSFNISQDLWRVAFAQFSDDFQDDFYLNQFYSKEEVIGHIKNMKKKGGETYIGKALDKIKGYFEKLRGSRQSEGVPQNLVVVTDGDSYDDVEDAAIVLRDKGIQIFVIAIGKKHFLQLLQIAGTPEKVFIVSSFDSMHLAKQKVIKEVCNKPQKTEPDPCSIDIAIGFEFSQRPRVPGELLISTQTRLRTVLQEIAHDISTVQGLSCLDSTPIMTNLSYGVVGHDGGFLDSFSFEGYSEDVVRKVLSWNWRKPSSFNTALLKTFGEKFKSKSKGNVKVLVIFSDGLDEDVKKLKEEAELLQKSGISALLVVALEGARDPERLQEVEFGRGFRYGVPLSVGMPGVGSAILRQIDSVSERECCCVMCECEGPRGEHGSRGDKGLKGELGQKGHSGFPGDEGADGERGDPGPSGSKGFQGCSGVRGWKGGRGLQGDRGKDGEDGLDGINGEQGVTGLDGSRGDRGNPGNPGIPGKQGEEGLKGQQGLRGDPGEPGRENTSAGAKGEPGYPGLPGSPGQNGLPGNEGNAGNEGHVGRRGRPGSKGRPGKPGAKGVQGSPGGSGPQGPKGDRGLPGPNGSPGFPGPQGPSGGNGDKGSKGPRGANGQKGQPGDPGDKGAAGPLGPRGMPGLDGRDGYGLKGREGVKGDAGFPGHPGLLGEDGVKGSKGHPGRKGNLGRGGNSGLSGESGVPGDPGQPGHRGPRGPPGTRDMTECQLITYIRDNCDRSPCPAFPTELVFGLDMSDDVNRSDFERQRSALLSLLEDISIAESNCPNGARVAVVGFSIYTKFLIRSQDYQQKVQLIDAVKNIALEKTSNKRHLGASMRFVGQHVFKRIRSGVLTRKVAVFFASGPSQNVEDMVTAMMEYRALNIVPVVISSRDDTSIRRATEVDDSGKAIFTVLRTTQDQAAVLRRVKNCAICYDPCRPSEECSFIQEPLPPQQVDVDLALVLDSSKEMQADEYKGAQQLLSSVVEQLVMSPQPRWVTNGARVALVQQSGTTAPKVEFNLQDPQSAEQMRQHLVQKTQQRRGSSVLGHTLEYILKEVLLQAVSTRRRRRTILTVVGTKTILEDQAKLNYISQKAICDGVAVFVVAVGSRYNQTQVEQLAGVPKQQHLITVSRMKEEEQGYVQRFFRVFLSALKKGIFTYPPPSLKQKCEELRRSGQIFIGPDQEDSGDVEEHYVEQRQGQTEQEDISETRDGQTFMSGTNTNDPNDRIKAETTNLASKDACLLRQDEGDCQTYVMMWFFDTEQGKCTRFWYSGCGGNENRFKTRDECESLCLMKSW